MLIDTHTHLYSEQFQDDIAEVLKNAIKNGITTMLLPNIDVNSIEPMLRLTKEFPENCFPMMGLHPGYVNSEFEHQLSIIEKELFENTNKYIAVGEIGMDLYWDKTFQNQQEIALIKQIEWAKKLKLPIVLHVREAFDEVFKIIDQQNDDDLKGIFHCFTGNLEQANHILSYGGFKLGIGGVVTYKNSNLVEVLKQINLQHIVLETDSPYLPPVPYRGKRNESAYLLHIAEKLTEIYNLSFAEIGDITSKNAKEVFDLL